eukprot:TRINITY_DN10393_c0_g1_i1.p2 TRINITY_DN10393_c0_g1~~TRINITY_DN10393_c0_g1_i1.p2  ORF type:complete len:345 (+),score=149.55 TRINITY_DN10393_c0_g1_i1:59-1036(+)
MRDLKGRVAVITGAASGMGRELALLLAAEGTHLALADVSRDKLERTAADCRAAGKRVRVSTHVVDVASSQRVKEFAREVEDEHKKVHLLFNNAGVAAAGSCFDAMSEEDFDWCLRINLNGVISCTRAFLPLLKAQDKAFIVNTSSVAGYFPLTGSVTYTTSKFAVRGFTECLLTEMRQLHPHVNVACVHPGIIKTDIITSARMQVDKRLHEKLPSVARADLTGKTDAECVAQAKQTQNKMYERFGYTAREAAVMILDGVKKGSTRIRVGWDAVYFDWWVRLFPRIFETQAGAGLVMLTSVVLRRLYGPLLAAAALGFAVRGCSKL